MRSSGLAEMVRSVPETDILRKPESTSTPNEAAKPNRVKTERKVNKLKRNRINVIYNERAIIAYYNTRFGGTRDFLRGHRAPIG
jgi:hypothetical protein